LIAARRLSFEVLLDPSDKYFRISRDVTFLSFDADTPLMKPCCDSSKNPDWRYIFSNNQYDDVLITVVEEVIRGQPDNEENFFQLNFASYFTDVDNTKPIAVNATEAEVLEATYE
jgi:hypothetical protein